MKSDYIIRVDHISLQYKAQKGGFTHEPLKDISFDVFSGETVGILGRNGTGKSSLLKILAGIINPSQGNVLIKKNITRSLLALGIGFMPHISGRENALYSAMLNGMSKKKALMLLPKIEEFSELGEFFDQPVESYSTGMMARLGFSTALMTEVDLLLIDEVLSVGDLHFRKKAEDAMRSKIASDQTVILVSHDSGQVNQLCGRAIWINDGLIVAEGHTPTVAHQYNLYMQSLDSN